VQPRETSLCYSSIPLTTEVEDVAGSIHLVLHTDGRVEFSCTGLFKNSPDALADLLESVTTPK
jgi:hypothetical protein